MTTRHGGVSSSPFDSLNLGTHVGDKLDDVLSNRARLHQTLQLPSEPIWLDQVHGTQVAEFVKREPMSSAVTLTADASYTRQPGVVCAIMTADCLPILLCNRQGTEVAAVHAGWRSLCHGIVEQTLGKFFSPLDEIYAYLGPAIGPLAFQVGAEVRDEFMQIASEDSRHFVADGDKYLADLQSLAVARLTRSNIQNVFTADMCTYKNSKDFFSYRRDGKTGRMASLIWMNA